MGFGRLCCLVGVNGNVRKLGCLISGALITMRAQEDREREREREREERKRERQAALKQNK